MLATEIKIGEQYAYRRIDLHPQNGAKTGAGSTRPVSDLSAGHVPGGLVR